MTIDGDPQIMPYSSDDMNTVSSQPRSERGVPVTAVDLAPTSTARPPFEGFPSRPSLPYVPPMTSANSIIAAIDARRPGMKVAKKLLLLFFVQGHHLAWAGEPLFSEALYATDRGVSLQNMNREGAVPIDSEALLGTISNVVIRYSGLSPADLRTLVQGSQPWQLAREAGDDARIELAWLTDWFRRPDETDDPDDERPNRAERAEAEAYLASRARP